MKTLSRPEWIRTGLSWDVNAGEVKGVLTRLSLNSVCMEAACPNRSECWNSRNVTFMILGKACTRGCRFCNVAKTDPETPDPGEPERIAISVKELSIRYAVVTSVTRDDLEDKGAGQFIRTVEMVKKNIPDVLMELLIPDLDAETVLLNRISFSGADVIGHNIEMPEALYPEIRPDSDYRRSLKTLGILGAMKQEGPGTIVKSSIVIGLGEDMPDILRTMEDLSRAGVDILYIGQYLSPSRAHWPVKKYYDLQEFTFLNKEAERMGFKAVCSGPLVRSSYRAERAYLKARDNIDRT